LNDGTGTVQRGAKLTTAEAVARRNQGYDVVVCGLNSAQNYWEARAIESAVGPAMHEVAHFRTAGPRALNHYHQKSRSPTGHTFYEQPPTRTAV
jgi:hypothetical protein